MAAGRIVRTYGLMGRQEHARPASETAMMTGEIVHAARDHRQATRLAEMTR